MTEYNQLFGAKFSNKDTDSGNQRSLRNRKRKTSNLNDEFEVEDFVNNPRSQREVYSKQSFNKRDMQRIWYIKEKKELERLEQQARDEISIEDESEDKNEKKRKPKMKNTYLK